MRAFALAFALLASACSELNDKNPLVRDAGLDAGPFSLSGTAALHPVAARWHSTVNTPAPGPEGLLLSLEDPFVADHAPDAGVDLSASLPAAGTFSFSDVDARVTVGLAARLVGAYPSPSPQPFLFSESFLFEGRARSVADAQAWFLSPAFASALAQATGIGDLVSQGFLLGVVHDAQGQPGAGVAVTGHDLPAERVRYLGADLALAEGATATTAAGAFLVVGEVDLMNFAVTGAGSLVQHKALVRPGEAFLVVFAP